MYAPESPSLPHSAEFAIFCLVCLKNSTAMEKISELIMSTLAVIVQCAIYLLVFIMLIFSFISILMTTDNTHHS